MNTQRKITVAFGAAFCIISMAGFLYTLFMSGNANTYPVFIAFAIVGGTMIHGKAIWRA